MCIYEKSKYSENFSFLTHANLAGFSKFNGTSSSEIFRFSSFSKSYKSKWDYFVYLQAAIVLSYVFHGKLKVLCDVPFQFGKIAINELGRKCYFWQDVRLQSFQFPEGALDSLASGKIALLHHKRVVCQVCRKLSLKHGLRLVKVNCLTGLIVRVMCQFDKAPMSVH